MKSATLLMLCITGSILFSSCGKSYTCSCLHPFMPNRYEESVKGQTRAKAEKKCIEIGKDKGQPTYDGPYDCYLK